MNVLRNVRACAGVFDVSAANFYTNTILTKLLKPGFSSRASADLTLAYGLPDCSHFQAEGV